LLNKYSFEIIGTDINTEVLEKLKRVFIRKLHFAIVMMKNIA